MLSCAAAKLGSSRSASSILAFPASSCLRLTSNSPSVASTSAGGTIRAGKELESVGSGRATTYIVYVVLET